MPADIDLCNWALDLVGQTRINSIDDPTEAARVCKVHYKETVREVLRDGRRKSAQKQQPNLGLLSTDAPPSTGSTTGEVGGWPPGNTIPWVADGCSGCGDGMGLGGSGFNYIYQLPIDYIRLITFNSVNPYDMDVPLFQIMGQTLITGCSSASIVYVCDVLQNSGGINLLDPMLIEAIYTKLATKLAWRFQQSRTLNESLQQKYIMLLAKARAVDSRDERAVLENPWRNSSWIRSRWAGTNA